jgi:hypothetical protein
LRRNRTDTGPHPWRHRTDRKVLRLNRTPNLAGRRISSDDRKRSSLNHETTLPAPVTLANPAQTANLDSQAALASKVRARALAQPKDSGIFAPLSAAVRSTCGVR